MDLRMQPGILGTGASLMADLTLLAYIILIVPGMLIGFFFARRKWFEPHHKFVMTGIVLINWVLILVLMQVSYREGVLPNLGANLTDPVFLLPTIHLITGAAAQLLGTYLVIRMWFEKQLPAWFKVRRIKRYMRTTLALWLVTAALGITIYVTWYRGASAQPEGDVGAPVATPDVTEPPIAEPSATEDAAADPVPAETPEAEIAPSATDETVPEPAETPEASG